MVRNNRSGNGKKWSGDGKKWSQMVEQKGQEMVIIGRQNGRQMVKEWPEMVKKTSEMAGKRSANGRELVD